MKLYRLAALATVLNATLTLLLVATHVWVDETGELGYAYALSSRCPLALFALVHLRWTSWPTLWLLAIVLGGSAALDLGLGIVTREPVHIATALLSALLTLAAAIPLTARQFFETVDSDR